MILGSKFAHNYKINVCFVINFFFWMKLKIKCVICCRPSEDKKDEKVVRDVFGDSDEDEPSPYRAPQNESHHESPVSASHKMTDMTLTDQPFFKEELFLLTKEPICWYI